MSSTDSSLEKASVFFHKSGTVAGILDGLARVGERGPIEVAALRCGIRARLSRAAICVTALSAVLGGISAKAQISVSGNVVPGNPTNPVWNVDQDLIIGNTGTGNMILTAGGTVNSGGEDGSSIGNFAGSSGTVIVDGGTWNDLAGQAMGIGNGGNGALNLISGALNAAGLYIGTGSTGSGAATVSGGNLTSYGISVGDKGIFELSGGSVTLPFFYGLVIGQSSSTANFTVSGGTLTAGSSIVVASGAFHLVNGTVSSDGAVATGGGLGSSISVSGGTWSTGALSIAPGSNSRATFTLTAGNVTSTSALIAYYPDAIGSANVSGGTWTISSNLTVGAAGNATINISEGSVSAENVLVTAVSPEVNGTVNLTGGTLSTDQISKGAGNGTVMFSGGTLRLSGNQTSLFDGFDPGDVTLVGIGATIDTQDFNVGTSYGLSGNGSLTKRGNGSLTLAGNNTYTGSTIVSEGSLFVNGSLASSQVTVENGASLGGSGSVGQIVLATGGKLNSDGVLSAESLVWTAGSLLYSELGPSSGDVLSLTGAFTKSGTGPFEFTFLDGGWVIGQTYTLVEFSSTTFSVEDFAFTNSLDGYFGLSSNALTFTVVPEPSTAILLAAGLSIAALVHRRKAAGV